MKAMGRKSISSVINVILNVMWYMSFVGVGLVGLLMLFGAFQALTGRETLGGKMTVPVVFELEVGTYEIRSETIGIDEVEMGQATGEMSFDPPVGWFFFGNLIVTAVGLVVVLWVLGLLRAVFRTLRSREPFVAANADRIRLIGIAIIAGEVVKSFVVGLELYYVMNNFSSDQIHFGMSFDIQGVMIIVGFTVIVISEVFRLGTQLKQEQELTV